MKNTATPPQAETPEPLTQREEEQVLAEFEFLEDLVLNWMNVKIGGEKNQAIQYLSDDMIFTIRDIQELTEQRMQEQGKRNDIPQKSAESYKPIETRQEQKALQVLAGKLKAPQAQA